MIKNLLVIFIILFAYTSCTKKEYSGEFPLEEFSKQILPDTNKIVYESTLGIVDTLNLYSERNYFVNDIWETDGGSYTVEYYGDFEHIIKNYKSNEFTLNYHLYVEVSTSGTWNFLVTDIESNFSNEIINFRVATEENDYGWPTFEYLDSVELNDSIFTEVYSFDESGKTYYFQLFKGLIGFEYSGNFWTIY
jgi:hypothetical protein